MPLIKSSQKRFSACEVDLRVRKTTHPFCEMGKTASSMTTFLQIRPIEMRAKILYLANQWMDFKMLLMSNRFLCRFGGVLISGNRISQFLAQF